MKIKETLRTLRNKAEARFQQQFGFETQDLTFLKIVAYLHEPKDASSLAVTRILFGAAGIMLGYKYRISSSAFAICFCYLLLVEKSFWNNHSYLFGLVGLLLACTDASCYWSLDVYLDPTKKKETVPYWNYFILKYQFFILYFMAGVKKSTAEWLTGYSVQNLSEHWVFAPFRLFLTVAQTDYLVVHWFIFAFDLTVAIWMMWGRTRHIAMLFCALFHLMNSRLFRIGMFPWVCLATMPLFYPFNWPKLAIQFPSKYFTQLQHMINYNIPSYTTEFKCKLLTCKNNELVAYDECSPSDETLSKEKQIVKETSDQTDKKDEILEENNVTDNAENNKDLVEAFLNGHGKEYEQKKQEVTKDRKSTQDPNIWKCFTVFLIIFHVVMQAFLPFSHFITKGYNNWTKGLYGYSWDMMVHTWEPHSIIVKVVDNERFNEFYVDPHLFAPNDRWSRHGDMVHQYAHCLNNKILESGKKNRDHKISGNISIYVDIWCSMNGRFAQRMFDPKVDILKVTWSPFEDMSYLMPILDEAEIWRATLDEIREEVHKWSNYSDVTFFADFPGYSQEKFIPNDLQNVTLTLLQGLVAFEPELTPFYNGQSTRLETGDNINVKSGTFHRVINIGESYAYYMYTFFNSTEAAAGKQEELPKPKLPIGYELARRFSHMIKFGNLVVKSISQILLQVSSTCQ